MKRYYSTIQELLGEAGWTWNQEAWAFTRRGETLEPQKISGHTPATFRETYPDVCKELPKENEETPAPASYPGYWPFV